MNWIVFFVVLIGVPLAGVALGAVQIAVIRLIIRWVREALRCLLAMGLLVGFATVVGVTWK
jgi:hypothetical protein